jgi:spectinomycin phosphotransferase
VLAEPPDLTTETVLDVVRAHWDDAVVAAAFLPVGTGAHHWVAAGKRRPRWFVTADDVTADGRLDELLDTYAAARELARRGHHLVVPTVPPQAGSSSNPGPGDPVGVVLPRTQKALPGGYLVTVTGYLEGESGPGDYVDDDQRAPIAGALGALHAEPAPPRIRPWAPGPPQRSDLTRLLSAPVTAWSVGPCGEPARVALQGQEPHVRRLIARYDELAERGLARRDDWVPTHGEPHTANVLWLAGGPVLVDWESLRLAPRERDLRTVLRGADGALPLSAYTAHGGSADLDDDMVELFDLESWLRGVADLAVRFAQPHTGDDDDQRALAAFVAEIADL